MSTICRTIWKGQQETVQCVGQNGDFCLVKKYGFCRRKKSAFLISWVKLVWKIYALDLPDQQRTQSIQEMDLHRISSMRRNQIISDVFSQLDLMYRRGSGIDRILNSYTEVTQKPTFYLDSDIFLATLPNRSVANPAQISLDDVATAAQDLVNASESLAT